MISSFITRKVLNEKIFYYSVLESSRDELQEYAKAYRVSHLKSWRWPSRDRQVTIQDEINDIILCLPWNHTTFVWNIFL